MDPWIKLLEFWDHHPIAFTAILVSASAVLAAIGLPMPKRMQKQTTEGVETTWSLSGGIPGIGPGLVALGRAIIKASETNATEREAARTAHAVELQAHRAELTALRNEQNRTTSSVDELAKSVTAFATEMRALVMKVTQLLDQRAREETPIQSTDRASSASCTPLSRKY
jgi:hypothetical protein